MATKGDRVFYNGSECEVTAVNDDGSVDLQELADPTNEDGTPKKDANGASIPKRWYGSVTLPEAAAASSTPSE